MLDMNVHMVLVVIQHLFNHLQTASDFCMNPVMMTVDHHSTDIKT